MKIRHHPLSVQNGIQIPRSPMFNGGMVIESHRKRPSRSLHLQSHGHHLPKLLLQCDLLESLLMLSRLLHSSFQETLPSLQGRPLSQLHLQGSHRCHLQGSVEFTLRIHSLSHPMSHSLGILAAQTRELVQFN